MNYYQYPEVSISSYSVQQCWRINRDCR